MGCELNNKELVVYPSSAISSRKFSIDLFNNKLSKSYAEAVYPNVSQVVIGKQCCKYHFFYNGIADVYKKSLMIKNIRLDKYHFIRIHGPTHFTVNGSTVNDFTNIKITTPDFKTKELSLPLINFDFSSKRKLDAKLRNIQLLG